MLHKEKNFENERVFTTLSFYTLQILTQQDYDWPKRVNFIG